MVPLSDSLLELFQVHLRDFMNEQSEESGQKVVAMGYQCDIDAPTIGEVDEVFETDEYRDI